MIYSLLGIAAIIIGVVVTAVIVKNKKLEEYDKTIHRSIRKHNIAANPILIAYLTIPIVIAIMLLIYYYGG